jgi:fibronectin type 3 domain-containing protein
VDATIVYGKTYEYFVQSVEKSGERYIESEASPSISFKPVDTFPPAVPTGLTAVPGTRTIELVWDRNVEKDFSAYRVYRDGVKIEDALAAPAYADRNVKIGTKYRYQIGAVDNAGNQSALSAAVEAAIP